MALALDGSSVQGIISGAAATTVATSSISATGASGVALAFIANNNGPAQITVSSVSGGGLTWAKAAGQFFRDTANFNFIDGELWWAPYSAPFSGAITATLSGSCEGATILAQAVSGAALTSPFDPATLPIQTNQAQGTGTPAQTSLTTTIANDLLFAFVFSGSGNINTWTTQSGFTTLGNVNGFSGSPNFRQAYAQGEYEIVSATQTSLTIGFVDNTDTSVLIVGGLKQAGSAPPASPWFPMAGDASPSFETKNIMI